jgi:hypothetical protein
MGLAEEKKARFCSQSGCFNKILENYVAKNNKFYWQSPILKYGLSRN